MCASNKFPDHRQKQDKQKKAKKKKQEALRNKLLPRIFQYKCMNDQRKKSTAEAVVVPPTQNVFGFRTNCYLENEMYLRRYISPREFNQAVKSVNDIIEHRVIEHQKNEKMDVFVEASILLKVAIGFAIVGIIVMASIVYFDFWGPLSKQQNITQYVAAAFLIVSSICAISGTVTIQLKKFVKFNNQALIYNELIKCLDAKNIYFIQTDRPFLKWEIDQRFFWLTLKIKLVEVPDDFECLSEGG